MGALEKLRKPLLLIISVVAAGGLFWFLWAEEQRILFRFISLFFIVNIGVMLLYHRGDIKRAIFLFAIVAIIAWFVVLVGVKTGAIFGVFSYGSAIGMKVLGVPLLVGFGWAILIYMSFEATRMLTANNRRMAAAAGLMVAYDILLEPVAKHLKLWQFERNEVPFQNYVVWFLLAYVLLNLVRKSKIGYSNPVVIPLLTVQLAFLLLLDIILLAYKL